MAERPQKGSRSEELRSVAAKRTPGGVHSNTRLSGPMVFIEKARGAWLWDVDGRNFVDYLLGQGPNFLGHAPDRVCDAVSAACRRGVIYGGQHRLEVEAAEAVCEALNWPDMVRFGVSGTEAVQAALRLARAATGRRKVIRFEGHYHGWLDNVLIAQNGDTWGAASAGQVSDHLDDFLVLSWNDAEAVADALAQHGGTIAALIMEPIMINAGVIEPKPGYLERVRDLCVQHGVVLIFDEVISGFRLGLDGAAGLYGVLPDLATYGKAMAGGWPVSALAGRADLMGLFGDGTVNHSGTFNSSVMGMAATVATISQLRDTSPYTKVQAHGRALMAGIRDLGIQHRVPLHIQGHPAAFHVSFGEQDAVDFRTLQRLDLAGYAKLATGLVENGVWVAARGVWYVSASHGPAELDATLDRFDHTLTAWLRT